MLRLIKHHAVWSLVLASIAFLIVLLIVFTISRNNVDYVELKQGPIIEAIYVKEGSLVEKDDNLIEMEHGPLFKAPFAGTVTPLTTVKHLQQSQNSLLSRLKKLTAIKSMLKHV